MLKRISTDEVQLGMFIHKLEGSWFSHPFWKRKFLLDDPDMLERLRESDVDGVIIDTERDGHRVSFNMTFKEFGFFILNSLQVRRLELLISLLIATIQRKRCIEVHKIRLSWPASDPASRRAKHDLLSAHRQGFDNLLSNTSQHLR